MQLNFRNFRNFAISVSQCFAKFRKSCFAVLRLFLKIRKVSQIRVFASFHKYKFRKVSQIGFSFRKVSQVLQGFRDGQFADVVPVSPKPTHIACSGWAPLQSSPVSTQC